MIVDTWYGGEKKKLYVHTGTCLWYSSGEKPLPINWVIVKDNMESKAEAFFSTELLLEPVKIINRFILRWNIEITFEETRAHVSIETQGQ